MQRRTFLTAGVAGAALANFGLPGLVRAQERTGRVVVGFAAGGPGDFLARTIAEGMKPAWAPNTIVENRPGAGGRIAVDAVRTAAPDGLTLLNTPASILTILPHAYAQPPFDSFRDLTPIAGMSELDFCFIVAANVPANSLAEFLDLAKKDAKTGTYGTAGVGSTPHMLGFLMGRAAGVALTHAPYRGGAPAVQDVLAGQLPSAFATLSAQIDGARKAGQIKVLATSGTTRSTLFPDVPTIEEAGLKGVSATDWSGLLAPATTPPAIAAAVSQAALDAVRDPKFAAAIARFGMKPLPLAPAEFTARLRREYDLWAPLVKAAGFTQDS